MFRQSIKRMFSQRFGNPRGMAKSNRTDAFCDKSFEQIIDRRVGWRASKNFFAIGNTFANECDNRCRLARARWTMNQCEIIC